MSSLLEKLDELVGDGFEATTEPEYNQWSRRVASFLATAMSQKVADDFQTLSLTHSWTVSRDSRIGMLEGLVAKMSVDHRFGVLGAVTSQSTVAAPQMAVAIPQSKKVFVVHGHDVEVKEMVARFIERLGLEPVILHEQPSSGRTVIEKFEVYADVGFAVVLLTPDDVGSASSEPSKLKGRARQNVILELGYFMGKLKRSRVCALYKQGVEIPSDYQGVLYAELDDKGAWRTRLAQELSDAKLPIKLEALLNS